MKAYPFLIASLLFAPEIAAQEIGTVAAPGQVDRWIRAAYGAAVAGEADRAARLYAMAASQDPELAGFLRYRAVDALLSLPEPPMERLGRLADGLETSGYDGAAYASVRVEALGNGGFPTEQTLRAAVETDDREIVCEHVTQALAARKAEDMPAPQPIVDIHHGWCSDTEVQSFAPAFEMQPSAHARVRRAERLYGQVRFYATVEELDALGNVDGLDTELRCRALFVRGRALYRIRKRRSESDPAYQAVVDSCAGDEVRSLQKKALYALGKRRWELDDPSGAKTYFDKLLAEFPERSHADDAVFYLARVARAQKDRARELELLKLAETEYADGDMFGELVWEVFEHLYREKKYQEFIDAIGGLSLPEHDNQYYSQGRLEYFVGRAHQELGNREEATENFATAWTKYPWSFYGYLSRMRLVALGSPPPRVEIQLDGVPPWLDDAAWRGRAAGRLDAQGLVGLAAAFTAGTKAAGDADRWRLAYVFDKSGRYPVSHNVVRRQIGGRPWNDPLAARHVQWRLAWPDPFGDVVEAAVKAESEQAGSTLVQAALPRAIMREESSFIPDIESYAGALGLMQLMPRTALGHDDDVDGEATPERLADPAVNVRVGVDHLYWLGKRFDGHPVLIAAAYNAGAGAVGKWLAKHGSDDPAMFVEDIPALQTRDYTKRVIGSYAAYQYLSDGEQFDNRVLRPTKP